MLIDPTSVDYWAGSPCWLTKKFNTGLFCRSVDKSNNRILVKNDEKTFMPFDADNDNISQCAI